MRRALIPPRQRSAIRASIARLNFSGSPLHAAQCETATLFAAWWLLALIVSRIMPSVTSHWSHPMGGRAYNGPTT